MPGSQLTQLKSALTSAGLNRKTASKKDRKSFKKGGARETDRAKTLAKLEGIRKSLNKFDTLETKVGSDPPKSGQSDEYVSLRLSMMWVAAISKVSSADQVRASKLDWNRSDER